MLRYNEAKTTVREGYSAGPGWDAVIGLGRPDGTKLLDLLDEPPSVDADVSGN